MEVFTCRLFIDIRGPLAPSVFRRGFRRNVCRVQPVCINLSPEGRRRLLPKRREALVVLDEPTMQRWRPEQRISAKSIRKDMWG